MRAATSGGWPHRRPRSSPAFPCLFLELFLILQVTHSDENTWRADWYELIRSTDAATQLPLEEFVNPLTGAKYAPASVYFNDGCVISFLVHLNPSNIYPRSSPVTWFVSRNNETGGVNLRIVQSGALMFSSTWANRLNFSESYSQSTNCSVKLYLYDGRVQGLLVKYTRIREQILMTVMIWLQQCTTSRKRSRYASSLVHMLLLLLNSVSYSPPPSTSSSPTSSHRHRWLMSRTRR